MRGFLIFVVGVLASFVGGKFYGESAMDAIASKIGWDRPPSQLEQAITARAESEKQAADLTIELADAKQQIEDMTSAVATQPASVVKLVTVQARIQNNSTGAPLDVTRGLRTNQLLSLSLKIIPSSDEGVQCRPQNFKVILANGLKPKTDWLVSSTGAPIDISRFRQAARSGDRLVIDDIRAECNDQILTFDAMSFPIQ